MNRTLNIVLIVIMWCTVAAYIALATIHSHRQRAKITISDLRIVAEDRADTRVVTTAKISKWLQEGGINPVGQPLDAVDIDAIERHLASHPEVKKVLVWANLDGITTIRVEGRQPAFHVQTTDGHCFYFTDDGHIILDEEQADNKINVHVPLITGSAELPFPISAHGNYAQMQRDNYNDFLEQFTAIESEYQSLTTQRASIRTNLRATRASGPKRFWGSARRERFAETKAEKIATLTHQQKNLDDALLNLAEKKLTLQQKEKKSYESYRFLPKLANFVNYIEDSDFWRQQVTEIRVHRGSENRQRNEIELQARLGPKTVAFGELDGTEIEKLQKLKTFYITVPAEYSYIDVKYKDQIICVK